MVGKVKTKWNIISCIQTKIPGDILTKWALSLPAKKGCHCHLITPIHFCLKKWLSALGIRYSLYHEAFNLLHFPPRAHFDFYFYFLLASGVPAWSNLILGFQDSWFEDLPNLILNLQNPCLRTLEDKNRTRLYISNYKSLFHTISPAPNPLEDKNRTRLYISNYKSLFHTISSAFDPSELSLHYFRIRTSTSTPLSKCRLWQNPTTYTKKGI